MANETSDVWNETSIASLPGTHEGSSQRSRLCSAQGSHQVHHCLETDSTAAIHGDDIIAEGEPGRLDRLDEVLKRLVVVKVLDRVGPRAAEHGQYLKRHIMYINGHGFEWLEDPKHLAAIIRNRSKVGAKPQSSPGSKSKDFGRSDPEALDELEEVEGNLYQQDTGISIYVSSGRFDIQFCVKRLCEMMKNRESWATFDLQGWQDTLWAQRSLCSDSIIKRTATL